MYKETHAFLEELDRSTRAVCKMVKKDNRQDSLEPYRFWRATQDSNLRPTGS